MVNEMKCNIDTLAHMLNLTDYQANVLKSRPDVYKLSGLVKRGHALYAPRVSSFSFLDILGCIFLGRRADLIGGDKMLVQNTRGIEFFADGFYSAPIGKYRYYADDNGNIVTRDKVSHK